MPSSQTAQRMIGLGVIMTFLGFFQMFGNALPFISPLSSERVSVLSSVRTKLEQKANTYTVKKETSFAPAVAAGAPFDNARAYAVVDFESGEVIAEKELSQPVPIASITKIMTAVTALDLMSPDEVITVSDHASRAIPTKIMLEPGEKLTLRELMHAMLLTSANDAAQAIADGIDAKYGEEVFIKSMNLKAQYIGLKHSRFANPQGFDNPNNFSTAEDLAILSHYALSHYPLIDEIVQKSQEEIPSTREHKHYVLYNWNGLIGVYPGVYGIKIGNTDDAGTTTTVVAEREGKKVLAVVLGANDVLERDLWAAQLLDVGYETLANLPPVEVTEDQLRQKYATWVPWN